jgi:hypothetical protein
LTEKNIQTAANTPGANPDPLDHDGDGRKGGSVAGQRVKKGAPLPSAAEIGSDPSKLVTVRITVKGDKRVHDGDKGRFDANDEVVIPLGVANELQARSLAEIVGTAD